MATHGGEVKAAVENAAVRAAVAATAAGPAAGVMASPVAIAMVAAEASATSAAAVTTMATAADGTASATSENPVPVSPKKELLKELSVVHKIQNLPSELQEIIYSCWTAENISIVNRTRKNLPILYRQLLDEHKVGEELLQQVLNANPIESIKILARFRSRPESTSIILKRVRGKEAYWSNTQHKMITKRKWNSISPLEAAAWSGDNFLVQQLLEQVPEEQKIEAAKQLQGILYRKDTEENGAYLAPYLALDTAYKNYIAQLGAPDQDRGTLDRLWLEVGRCQRLLPTYGLQEFCNKKSHSPIPAFNEEPSRSCVLYDNSALDFDKLGSTDALLKGIWPWCGWGRSPGAGHDLDSTAFSRLCEVRTSELSNIIHRLLNSVPPAQLEAAGTSASGAAAGAADDGQVAKRRNLS